MQCIVLKLTSFPQSQLLVLTPIAHYAAQSYVHKPWSLTDAARYILRSLPPQHPLTYEGVLVVSDFGGRVLL